MVSVIVPTYNRAAMVCDCVASVLASDYPDYEVIVVDDCSPDDTGARIAERFGGDVRVRYVRNETNLQAAGSRNHGAALARGEYLFFVDDDNLIAADCMRQLLHGFELDPRMTLVAPLALQRSARAVWTLGASFNGWTSMPINLHENEQPDSVAIENRLYPTWYSPNAFMVRREAFERIGGFDTSYVITYEESDFGIRITERKHGAIYPMARTWHLGFVEPGNASALRCLGIESPSRAFYFARNRSVFVKRHFSFWGKVTVLSMFVPLFAVYYCGIALKNRRPDIAWAFLKGSVCGWFCPWRMKAQEGVKR